MNILGVELELDLFDADVIEVYEKENKRKIAYCVQVPRNRNIILSADLGNLRGNNKFPGGKFIRFILCRLPKFQA